IEIGDQLVLEPCDLLPDLRVALAQPAEREFVAGRGRAFDFPHEFALVAAQDGKPARDRGKILARHVKAPRSIGKKPAPADASRHKVRYGPGWNRSVPAARHAAPVWRDRLEWRVVPILHDRDRTIPQILSFLIDGRARPGWCSCCSAICPCSAFRPACRSPISTPASTTGACARAARWSCRRAASCRRTAATRRNSCIAVVRSRWSRSAARTSCCPGL